MVAIDFGRFSHPGRSGFESVQRLVNAYSEKASDNAKDPVPVYVRPGLTRFDTGTSGLSGPCRGMIEVPGNALYVAAGSLIRKFTSAGVASAITGVSLDGTGLVQMALNQNGSPEIGIVTNEGYYVLNTVTDILSKPTIAALPLPNGITFLDGYFVFSINDGRFFHSAINDATTVNALAFATAQSRSDKLRKVVNHRGALVLLGDTSLEIWENAGTTPFAFSRVRANIDIGCVSEHTVAQVAEALMWVDDDGIARRMLASEPERVSNHAFERLVQELTLTERRALYAVVTHVDGHDFYAVTSPYWTWVYDFSTGVWHECKTGASANWIAKGWSSYAGHSIVGSSVDQALYRLDKAAFKEDATSFTVVAQSGPVNAFPYGLIFDEVSIDFEPGVGLTGVDVDAAAPRMVLDWSDDGGTTWVGGREASLGRVGERYAVASFYQLGPCGRQGRSFRISVSASVMRVLFKADARIRKIRS